MSVILKSYHFNMIYNSRFEITPVNLKKVLTFHFESNDDFPFEMTGFKKYDCRFEMIYDCRFEMTGAKIFVNKILKYTKHLNQHFSTEKSPLYSSVRNLI